MGLACDRDGYDIRIPQCKGCGSRGCPKYGYCKAPTTPPQWFVDIYSEFQREQRALLVPNRLKGATINQDGDAT